MPACDRAAVRIVLSRGAGHCVGAEPRARRGPAQSGRRRDRSWASARRRGCRARHASSRAWRAARGSERHSASLHWAPKVVWASRRCSKPYRRQNPPRFTTTASYACVKDARSEFQDCVGRALEIVGDRARDSRPCRDRRRWSCCTARDLCAAGIARCSTLGATWSQARAEHDEAVA